MPTTFLKNAMEDAKALDMVVHLPAAPFTVTVDPCRFTVPKPAD